MTRQTLLMYGSLTPGDVPVASNMTTTLSGVELAVNAADGKLFFKDVAGNVRVLADAASTAPDAVAITGGTIDGTTVGGMDPSSGNFTALTSTALTVSSLTGLLKSSANSGVSVAVPGTDYLDPATRGAALGVASLDASGKIPVAQLPSSITGALYYAGTWDAITNTPTLTSSVGSNGVFYKVRVAGSTNLNGVTSWDVGDTVIFNSTMWGKIPGTDAPVQSVNDQTGVVTITPGNIGAASSGPNSDITSLNGLTSALSVAQGGTGRTTLTGLLKGNGTSSVVAAVVGTDYAAPPSGAIATLLANDGAGGFANVTLGTGLSMSGGVLNSAPGGLGTVTSVNVTGGTTGLSFIGGPVLNSGTLVMTGALTVTNGGTGATTRQAALNNLAGSTVEATFMRGDGTNVGMSGIQVSDVPTLNQDTTGTSASVTSPSQPAITSVGTLTSLTVSGPTTLAGVVNAGGSVGTVGQVLTSAGLGTPPVWASIPPQAIGVTSVQASGGTTGLTFSGGPVTTSGTLTLGGVLAVANGGTGTTIATGTGAVVRDTAPVLNGASLFNGELNSVSIGAAVPSSGAFTTLSAAAATVTNLFVTGSVILGGTGAIRVPSGTTVQRPASEEGLFRFNTTLGDFEGFKNGAWSSVGNDGGGVTPYTRVTSSYLAVNNDRLIADTSGGTFALTLPGAPTQGSEVIIVDGSDWSANKLILSRNGSSINGVPADYEVVAGKIAITAIYDGTTWKLFAKTLADASPATGTGSSVRSVSPVLVAPNLGTPSLAVLTNATGLPMTTGVTGILPAANGGTGAASLTGLVKGNGAAAMTAAVAGTDYAPATTGTAAQLLGPDSAGGFLNVTIGAGLSYSGGVLTSTPAATGVTSVQASGGTTGLTFSGGPVTSTGTVTLGGKLGVANGGTGAASLTGLVKGNGTAAMTPAVAGSDYAPATTASSAQLLSGNGVGGFANVTVGTGLNLAGGTLTATEQLTDGQGRLTFPATAALTSPSTGGYSGKLLVVMLDGEPYYLELRKFT